MMKMKTVYVDKIHLTAMVKALSPVPIFTVKRSRKEVTVTLPDGQVIFKAIKGSAKVHNSWLVRHVTNLFSKEEK